MTTFTTTTVPVEDFQVQEPGWNDMRAVYQVREDDEVIGHVVRFRSRVDVLNEVGTIRIGSRVSTKWAYVIEPTLVRDLGRRLGSRVRESERTSFRLPQDTRKECIAELHRRLVWLKERASLPA